VNAPANLFRLEQICQLQQRDRQRWLSRPYRIANQLQRLVYDHREPRCGQYDRQLEYPQPEGGDEYKPVG